MRRRLLGGEIFLVSFAVLLLQISYTRIFSFKLSSYFNGFFSVLGSLLVTIGSMSFGFQAVLVAAFTLYAAAGALLRGIRARPAAAAVLPGPCI